MWDVVKSYAKSKRHFLYAALTTSGLINLSSSYFFFFFFWLSYDFLVVVLLLYFLKKNMFLYDVIFEIKKKINKTLIKKKKKTTTNKSEVRPGLNEKTRAGQKTTKILIFSILRFHVVILPFERNQFCRYLI